MRGPSLSISALSRQLKVTPRTLRYYESIGLLHPEKRGRQRIYDGKEQKQLAHIIRWKRAGFPLQEIRALLDSPQADGEHLAQALERARAFRKQAQERLDDINETLDYLNEIERRLTQA